MSGNSHVLHIELGADCTRDVIEQVSPQLSTLDHRTVTNISDLSRVLQERNWNAIICSNKLPAIDSLHFANLHGMACQIRMDADNTLHLPYVSEGCLALLGIAPLEVELHPELLLNMLHPEDRDRFFQSMHESISHSMPWNWEGRIVTPSDGEIKWVSLHAACLETNSHAWEGFMVNITQSKLADQEIITSHQQLRELSSRIEDIKEEERRRIAREIHDEIGTLLTALKMDLSWLAQRLPQDGNALHKKVKSMFDLLDTATSSANNLVHNLRPGFLDCFGFVVAIEIEAKEFSKRTGIRCKIVKSDNDIELSGEQPIALFRVFQEALNNIMKHAEAKLVKIEILKTEECVTLIISDDGKGFDEESRNKPYSFGLRGIQERIEHLDGKVNITSEPGKGTRVEVCVPLCDADCLP